MYTRDNNNLVFKYIAADMHSVPNRIAQLLLQEARIYANVTPKIYDKYVNGRIDAMACFKTLINAAFVYNYH